MRGLIGLAAAVIVLAAWLYWQQRRDVALVVSGLIEADEIRVGSRVGGRVAEVVGQEGQRVRTGDVLVRIDPFDLRERLARASAELAAATVEHARLKAGYRPQEIAQAQARRARAAAILDKLKAGPRPREIEIARERCKVAQANLDLAEAEHRRMLRLRKEAQAAELEMDHAVRALKSAQAELAATEQELHLLEEGTRKEEIAEAQAQLAEAEQAVRIAEEGYRKEEVAAAAARIAAAEAEEQIIRMQLRELEVRSPCDCTIEANDLRPGDIISANAPSIALIDPTRLWVRAYVPEERLGKIKLDQRVPIRVDGFPNERFKGRISFIARQAEFTPRNVQTPEERSKQVFRIKVMIEEGLDRLRVGLSADVLLDEATGP